MAKNAPAMPLASPHSADPRLARILAGLSEVAADYDGFILDLWGVIHDGERLYPGTALCLEALRTRGKRTVLLSNAPRRVSVIECQLYAFGLPLALCGGIVSSGEEVHRALATRVDPWFAALGHQCFHLGAARDYSVWQGVDLEMVDALGEASFILNTGPWDDEATVAQYEELLCEAVARRLPMICANPDREVVRGNKLVLCAGALAARYEALGGRVRYVGKPHAAIYRRCFEVLGTSDPKRILAVGDSLQTDVAGAAALGMDTVFVTGGLYAAERGLLPSAAPDPAALAEFYRQCGIRPSAAMALFVW